MPNMLDLAFCNNAMWLVMFFHLGMVCTESCYTKADSGAHPGSPRLWLHGAILPTNNIIRLA